MRKELVVLVVKMAGQLLAQLMVILHNLLPDTRPVDRKFNCLPSATNLELRSRVNIKLPLVVYSNSKTTVTL